MIDAKQCDDGTWVVAENHLWLPGIYDTKETAERAAGFSDAALMSLASIYRVDGENRPVTMADLDELAVKENSVAEPMSYDELRDAIDGLYAYDAGSADSGVNDELLRQRVIKYVGSMKPTTRRKTLSLIMVNLCLTPKAIEDGYGWVDAVNLGEWFEENFGAA